jgi:hypothetical protein
MLSVKKGNNCKVVERNMKNIITAYFACDDEMITLAGERSGAPGLDENRDTFWVRVEYRVSVTKSEGYVFHPTEGKALEYAMKNNLPYVFEARFEPKECIMAINYALGELPPSRKFNLDFMAKELLRVTS